MKKNPAKAKTSIGQNSQKRLKWVQFARYLFGYLSLKRINTFNLSIDTFRYEGKKLYFRKKLYMQNLNQLKTAFIAAAFLLTVTTLFTSCKRDDVTPNPYQTEQTTASRQAAQMQQLTTSCSNSDLQQHYISLTYAYQLVGNYQRASRNKGEVCNIFDNGAWVLSEAFPAEVIQSILNQPGCCKFRVYNGLDSDNRQHFVIVGVNESGSDVLFCNSSPTTSNSSPCANINNLGIIVEMGNPCPQSCSGSYVAP